MVKDQEIFDLIEREHLRQLVVFAESLAVVGGSDTSGLAGIAHWINTYYKLKEEQQLGKVELCK